MRIRPNALHGAFPRPRLAATWRPRPRWLLTLAIETSCDDTSVAVLEVASARETGRTAAQLHFHKKITANNTAFNGVHPLVALESHQENLAKLVAEAIAHLPPQLPDSVHEAVAHLPSQLPGSAAEASAHLPSRLPDFVAVTRGPGMRSNLFTGLDTAKGLAVAWQKPLLGIHHMQAHALTPRLVDALQTHELASDFGRSPTGDVFEVDVPQINVDPDFPFLSVLASGGHTLLIHTTSLTENAIIGTTTDIAIGECLDKVARVVLPPNVLQSAGSTMYGALLETFAFPEKKYPQKDKPEPLNRSNLKFQLENYAAAEYVERYASDHMYEVPRNNEEALKRNVSKWGWSLAQPLGKAAGGLKYKSLELSFSGLTTAVERVVRYQRDPSTKKLTAHERLPEDITIEERRDLAQHVMRAAFEHLAGRVLLGLQQCPVPTVVMAGGVAANSYLRYILASTLCAHGYSDVKVVFPPPSLCSDNAAMIAWAGVEMFKSGARDQLSIRAIRKWPLDQLLSPPLEKTTIKERDPKL
ncbi:hypothetical protein P280DRAFT_467521 [Massarina eburnea CBS 473.64]|uniref:Gcp-like domain-containing protein n=1 Tax=Massarina eburnea CBS 473.64 TaxID=1395130 RepID=A0A6A6SBF3_9PLEO|nr:hypothetical protein P280DRAFT_467521 [Massarina eburnea CBS 473.64]